MNIPSPLKPLVLLVSKRFRDVPTEPGVYIVFWVREGRPVPIPRILGVDERGVLYIGSTGKSRNKDGKSTKSDEGLRKRIRNLWISIEMVYDRRKRKRYPHTFGPSLVYTGLYKVIGVEDLWIYYKVFNVCEAGYQEKLAILKYTNKYCEPPPLNLQVERQYSMLLDLGELGKSRLVDKLDPELRSVLGL